MKNQRKKIAFQHYCTISLTLKRPGRGVNLTPPPSTCVFSKIVSPKERVKPLVTSFLKISLNFLNSVRRYENFLCQRYLFSSIFINFLDFLTFPCYKETNNVSLEQTMSVFFHFQQTLNRPFNNCIKLY